MFASCGGKEQKKALSAEETVEACWKRIDKGDWTGAVALMDVAKQDKAVFVESLKEVCEPLREVGNIAFETRNVEIDGESATVQGVLTVGENQGEESISTINLIRRKGVWLISE